MRKNIYVRDEDAEIFEKAEQISGESISAVIAKALRQFINTEEIKKKGKAVEMEPHAVERVLAMLKDADHILSTGTVKAK